MESVIESPTARKISDYANGQVNNFLDSVEDLTKALKDIETPDIARVRAKGKLALMAAKSAVSDTAYQVGRTGQGWCVAWPSGFWRPADSEARAGRIG